MPASFPRAIRLLQNFLLPPPRPTSLIKSLHLQELFRTPLCNCAVEEELNCKYSPAPAALFSSPFLFRVALSNLLSFRDTGFVLSYPFPTAARPERQFARQYSSSNKGRTRSHGKFGRSVTAEDRVPFRGPFPLFPLHYDGGL